MLTLARSVGSGLYFRLPGHPSICVHVLETIRGLCGCGARLRLEMPDDLRLCLLGRTATTPDGSLLLGVGDGLIIWLRDGREIRLSVRAVPRRWQSSRQVRIGADAPRDVVISRSEQLSREKVPGAVVASG